MIKRKTPLENLGLSNEISGNVPELSTSNEIKSSGREHAYWPNVGTDGDN